MRSTSLVSSAVRTSAFAAVALATITASSNAQARNLRDPGRLFRDRPAKTTVKATAKGGPAAYNLFVTPSFGWDDNTQSIGGQLKYASDDLITNMPVAFSGSLSNLRYTSLTPAQNKLAMQLDAEVDVISNAQYVLALSGSMNHMSDIGTGWEFAPEFDWTLPANDMVSGSVGAIAYFNRFTFSSGGTSLSTTGQTLGIVGYLNRGTWSLIPEYDFDSDYNGEDTFSIKLSKRFVNMNRDPRILVGAAKHSWFMAGVRMTLH